MNRENKHRTVKDPIYGFRQLVSLPNEKVTTKFYQRQYYDLIRKGSRACELGRLIAGGKEAESERDWLHQTLYSDIAYVLDHNAPGKRVLDVGCGTGEFPLYLQRREFFTVQIEPSLEAVAIAESYGLVVRNSTLEEFVEQYHERTKRFFDAVILLNILEHVPNPAQLVELARTVLKPGGIILVRVPNDFSKIQTIAREKLSKEEWWVVPPDHINYFNFESLHNLLEELGFEVIYSQGDFPMEMFLLMGDDYVGNAEIGSMCHKKRVQFEMAVPGELRRTMYRSLAEVGIGRDCLVFGRKMEA